MRSICTPYEHGFGLPTSPMEGSWLAITSSWTPSPRKLRWTRTSWIVRQRSTRLIPPKRSFWRSREPIQAQNPASPSRGNPLKWQGFLPPASTQKGTPVTQSLVRHPLTRALDKAAREDLAERDAENKTMDGEIAVGGKASTMLDTSDRKLDACPSPAASIHARNTKRWTTPRGENSSRRVFSATFASRCSPARRTRTNV